MLSLILAAFQLTQPAGTTGKHYYDATNPALGQVTHCMYGSMTLHDNMWLIDAEGNKVDYHQLMANPSVNGLPSKTKIDAKVSVCQNGGYLQYQVQ
jgi:hypothetical protein